VCVSSCVYIYNLTTVVFASCDQIHSLAVTLIANDCATDGLEKLAKLNFAKLNTAELNTVLFCSNLFYVSEYS
jgi:hypothetical protein